MARWRCSDVFELDEYDVPTVSRQILCCAKSGQVFIQKPNLPAESIAGGLHISMSAGDDDG